MKTLFLVRHAKSSWDHPEQEDMDRPLNQRGLKDAPRMAQIIMSQHIVAEKWITSPALRARTTANIFAAAMKKPESEIIIDEVLYSFSESEIIKMIEEQDNNLKTMMLFFHNPTISEILLHYTLENYDMPTCAVAGIRFNTNSWSAITANSGELFLYEYPKKYG